MKHIFMFFLLCISFNLKAEPVLSTSHLIQSLQSGGHIIYMRHGKTDKASSVKWTNDLTQCNTQRNLSDEGRAQVKKISLKISQLGIPIGKVLASPYCRTKETAELAFGSFEIDENLKFSISKKELEAKKLGEHLKNAMLKATTGGMNAVFVGHSSNLKDGLGVWPKPEGVIVVFKNTNGSLIYKGMIKPKEWLKQ